MKENIGLAVTTGLGITIRKSDILFFAIGILLLLSIVLLLIIAKRGKIRKLESIDKGRKLAEAIENPWKSKQIVAGMVVYGFAVVTIAIIGVIEVIRGNTKFITSIIPVIGTLLSALTIFLSPRKCYIYENGIQYRLRFIRWDEIKDFEWKNGVLKIKAKGVRELALKDENGNIRKIFEKMVKK